MAAASRAFIGPCGCWDIAQGRIIQSLAGEGGLHSTLWAGPEAFSRAMKKGEQPVQGTVRKGSVSLKLGFAGTDYGYAIDLGLATTSLFPLDPVIINREPMDRRDADAFQYICYAQRPERPHTQRRRRLAASADAACAVRQHDDPLQRSARGA
jgi:predicted ATPase